MLTSFFSVVSQSPAVQALLGAAPSIRLYSGEAPQGAAYPYAVFVHLFATTSTTLSNGSAADRWTVQVDCYAEDEDDCVSLAGAVRDAVEGCAEIVSLRGTSRDPVTRDWNYQFDIEWLVTR